MLILTRRPGETVMIGKNGEITVTVLGIHGRAVRIGICAPKDVIIDRQEIFLRKQDEGPRPAA